MARRRRTIKVYQWMTRVDGKVCERCQRRSGRLYRATGDPSGFEGAAVKPHHGCRCRLRFYAWWRLTRWQRYIRRGRRKRPSSHRGPFVPVPDRPEWEDHEHEENGEEK